MLKEKKSCQILVGREFHYGHYLSHNLFMDIASVFFFWLQLWSIVFSSTQQQVTTISYIFLLLALPWVLIGSYFILVDMDWTFNLKVNSSTLNICVSVCSWYASSLFFNPSRAGRVFVEVNHLNTITGLRFTWTELSWSILSNFSAVEHCSKKQFREVKQWSLDVVNSWGQLNYQYMYLWET